MERLKKYCITQWTRGANYAGTCTISCGQHTIAANVDSDEADLICKAVNEGQRLIDSNRELVETMQRFYDSVIADKKVWDNQVSYWKGQFNTAINNAKNLLP